MGNIVGIDFDEAAQVRGMINSQSELAKEAITKVINSPQSLVSWRGKRKSEFETFVQNDMANLKNAIQMIDDAARKIDTAIQEFMRADGQ